MTFILFVFCIYIQTHQIDRIIYLRHSQIYKTKDKTRSFFRKLKSTKLNIFSWSPENRFSFESIRKIFIYFFFHAKVTRRVYNILYFICLRVLYSYTIYIYLVVCRSVLFLFLIQCLPARPSPPPSPTILCLRRFVSLYESKNSFYFFMIAS